MNRVDLPSWTNAGALLLIVIVAWPLVLAGMQRMVRTLGELMDGDDQ